MKIKNLLTAILALGMITAGVLTANAEDDIKAVRRDENGRIIREISSPVTISAGESEEASGLQNAELFDSEDNKLVVYEVKKHLIHLSEDTAVISIRVNNFLDAKYKLNVALVDQSQNVVAEQISCNYIYKSLNPELEYTLKYVPGFELDPQKNYTVKLTYAGDYDFENRIGSVGFMVGTSPSILSAEAVNLDSGIFRLYVANLSSSYEYSVKIHNIRYSPTSIDGNYITVTADDFEYDSETASVYIELYADNGNFERYCGSYTLPITVYGYDDEYYGHYEHNIYTSSYNIGINAKQVTLEAMGTAHGACYSAADAANTQMYLIDPLTGAKVGTGTVKYETYSHYLYSTLRINSTLVDNRKYLAVVEDPYSTRYVHVYATDKPTLDYCGLTDSGYSYSAYDIPNKANYNGQILNAYNMPDLSKIDISISDKNGNVIVALDKGSFQYLPASDWAENNLSFTMTRKANPDYDKEYTFTVKYDGAVISSNTCYFYPSYGSSGGSSSYINGYLVESFAAGTDTYMVLHMYDTYDLSQYSFVMESYYGEPSLYGNVYKTLHAKEYEKVVVIKFNGMLESGEYGDWALLAYDSHGNEAFYEYGHAVAYKSLPMIYTYSYVDVNGLLHLFGEGFENGTYKISAFDNATNKEVAFPLTNVNGTNEFTISTNLISSVSPKNELFFIESNTKWGCAVYSYYFDTEFIPSNAFYTKYKNIDHLHALLALPFGEYASYRISENADELSSLPFQTIKQSVLFKVSEADGTKTIYGQFKKADGTLSEVMSTKVSCDSSAPVLSNFVGLPGKLVKENDDYLTFEFSFDSTEAGMISVSYYDANGNLITDNTAYYYNIVEGQNQKQISLWCYEDEDFSKTAKIKLFAIDASGNRSEIYEFDVSVIELYSNVDVAGGYIKVNNQTGYIEYAEITADELRIPSNANGITIIGIKPYAFSDCNNITKVTIPATITEIPTDAFYGLTITEIVGREGSAAEDFANNSGLGFEVITAIPGDVTGDGTVNRQDLLRIAKYFAGWDVEIDTAASDVTGDGTVNRQDLLRLAKYFAGWDVTLG